MNWMYVIEHWPTVLSILVGGVAFAVSPFLWLRIQRTKNELNEVEVIVKKNRTIREELDLMNAKIDELTEEVRKLREDLHQERMGTLTLTAELDLLGSANGRLKQECEKLHQENADLRQQIDERDDPGPTAR